MLRKDLLKRYFSGVVKMPYIICILALISFMGCDDKKKEVEQKKIPQEKIEKIRAKAIEKMKEIVTHGYAPIIYKKYIKNDLLFPNLGSIRNRVYYIRIVYPIPVKYRIPKWSRSAHKSIIFTDK